MVSDLLPEPMTSSNISVSRILFWGNLADEPLSIQESFLSLKDRLAWIVEEKLTSFAKGFILTVPILSHRNEDNQMYEERIVIDPAVRHGKPIIKDTRVPVEIILGSLAGGMEIDEITKEYDLEREDVLAALAYAARIIAGEEISAYA